MFGSYQMPPAWRDHVCGLYYCFPSCGHLERVYLPRVELQAHATILATASRTVLNQTFVNPSSTKGIKEVKYTFPLYDGVSVVGFTCHVGDRVIVGEVKEKEKARHDFNEAVAKGETAGLFEQLDTADVFQTTVGNVPPGARVVVKITYLGELKHDMEVDGIRFTIPNIIAPRYGRYPRGFDGYNTAQEAISTGISITVDAEMAEGSFIQKILSPSHPIAVTMGSTSIAPNAEPTMAKASATLSLGTAQLNGDFILQIVAKDTGVPKAVLETHPRIPNQRALMATLVPKFALPPERPEIVFVCDRSGSMAGNNITLVKQALQIFLKSLPVGVMFNICSFGSSFSFLWPKSVAYSQETLDQAVRHVDTFAANYGGTEMLAPLKATIQQRYKDIPLEVMMLTDGAIWDQQVLFTYLNQQISQTKAPIRVYSLGVGSSVSNSLIEGIAKAGNGFSQSVGEGEKMDAKVVRMLKGALSPHVTNYMLEVKYSGVNANDPNGEVEDFEIVEKVADSLKVVLDLSEKDEKPKKVISLFDTSANLDKEEPSVYDVTGESRYSRLPKLHVPNLIQAPLNIPTLFAFNRTTVYLLLGPDSPQKTPTSVILRGTSAHGPLELEFPVQVLETPGEMIHQLAAKKAIAELEDGRGWLPEAKDEYSKPIKERYESRFISMVEREAVRLGVQFQVSGKWCSFVAVEKNQKVNEDQPKIQEKEGWEWLQDEEIMPGTPASDTSSSESTDLSTKDLSAAVSRLNEMSKRIGADIDEQNRKLNAVVYKSSNTTNNIQSAHPLGHGRGSFALDQTMSNKIQKVSERGYRHEGLAAAQSKAFHANARKAGSSGLFGGLFGSNKKSSDTSSQSSGGLFSGSGGNLFSSSYPVPPPPSPGAQPTGGSYGSSSGPPAQSQYRGFALAMQQQASFSHSGAFGQFAPTPPPLPMNTPPIVSQPTGYGMPSMSTQQHMAAQQMVAQQALTASQRMQMQQQQASAQQSQQMQMSPQVMQRQQMQMAPQMMQQQQALDHQSQHLPPGSSIERNHNLEDYQMQLMLLEQQNKKRHLVGRQESEQSEVNAFSSPQSPLVQEKPSLGMVSSASGPGVSWTHSLTSPSYSPTSASPLSSPNQAPPAPVRFGLAPGGFGSASAFGAAPSASPFAAPVTSAMPPPLSPFGQTSATGNTGGTLFGSATAYGATPAAKPTRAPLPWATNPFSNPPLSMAKGSSKASTTPFNLAPSKTPEEALTFLIKLQTFEGYWIWDPSLFATVRVSEQGAESERSAAGYGKEEWATALVVTFFEERLAGERGSWELVVEKARGWLAVTLGGEEKVEEMVNKARSLV
ncbi:hypothetical protein K458DRAFT_369278 [Lentithecium fluviatile CBS 122367]|uniref:VIT-domain-containing protein n=1 Tax=Lentithecium fluviatile CBS 122367 TaxID=1168545 RepID=A0A6G1IY95_9PLEO|nr:hypothetical protein K458DRAFT_369278 [Lentithecium fluviatile CBS 122367]